MRGIIFNGHFRDFNHVNYGNPDFTIEFNVKSPDWVAVSERVAGEECETNMFTDIYCKKCFDKIQKTFKNIRTWVIKDWSMAGRSGGWFVLICEGEEKNITQTQYKRLEIILNEFFSNYGKEMMKFYIKRFKAQIKKDKKRAAILDMSQKMERYNITFQDFIDLRNEINEMGGLL